MTKVRFADIPPRIARLARDQRGYPIPAFVDRLADRGGEPDFRIVDGRHILRCYRNSLCWICGDRLGAIKVFVIGPMCGINRISTEPPSHRDCAQFAARHCPFLSIPSAKRPDRPYPDQHKPPPGFMIEHNPGVCLLWATRDYRVWQQSGGLLFKIGDPEWISFWHQGRAASRAEIDAAIAKGYGNLHRLAEAEGADAIAALERQRRGFEALLPEAA